MSNPVTERGTPYLVSNANVQCFTGPGEVIGFFCSQASSTPLIAVYDANSNQALVDPNQGFGNGNQTVAPQFVPAGAVFYRFPSKVLNGCRVEINGNVVGTLYANRG